MRREGKVTPPPVQPPASGLLQIDPACRAVYSDGCVEVASTENEEVVVPLPSGVTVSSVVAVLHSGEERAHRHSPGPDGVLVMVPACSGPVRCVRMRW